MIVLWRIGGLKMQLFHNTLESSSKDIYTIVLLVSKKLDPISQPEFLLYQLAIVYIAQRSRTAFVNPDILYLCEFLSPPMNIGYHLVKLALYVIDSILRGDSG